ncbi:hypothetical protein F0562_035535 [Nyssa sinensis]|uniref:RING-type E3 ubiquitin transferase n=1 Tax=Nyssa sinensis TaxID=561372 RepID=A0A5J5ADA4_9ASTE|nr:hypothetical protein F0562_035535 [Nyssa sinensis]
MMGSPQTPYPPDLYSQALQIKLYQAFIFSIPILFSVILFLLFYLFYLKRRASTVSSPPSSLSGSSNHATPFASPSDMDLKGSLKEKLPIILFDEGVSTRDSQCCVCLGEFEMKEELHQVPSCKHVFHIDCICHWLCSHSTCPLCRSSIVTTIRHGHPEPPAGGGPNIVIRRDNGNFNQNPQIVCPEQEEELESIANYLREQEMVLMEGSSGASTSICLENEMSFSNGDSVILSINIHNT